MSQATNTLNIKDVGGGKSIRGDEAIIITGKEPSKDRVQTRAIEDNGHG